MAKLARTRRPRLTPAVMRRALMADRWVPRLARAIRLALDRQVREVVAEVRIGMMPGTIPHRLSWAQEMVNVQRRWLIGMASDGYDFAASEFGIRVQPRGKGTDALSKAEPIRIGRPPVITHEGYIAHAGDFLLEGDYGNIDAWIETTAAGSAVTTEGYLKESWTAAAASRDPETGRAWTNNQIANDLRVRGFAKSPARALMLARTGSIWSMNEGAHQRYKRMGVTVEKWITSVDDARCFPPQTIVETIAGDRPISSIRIGDLVRSASGMRRATAVIAHSYNGRYVILVLKDRLLICTEDHPIWIESLGWTEARYVQPGGIVQLSEDRCREVLRLVDFSFADSRNYPSALAKVTHLAYVLLQVAVPIVAVYLKRYFSVRDNEINAIPSYLDLLLKRNIQTRQRVTNGRFNRRFTSIPSITGERAESSMGRRNRPESLTAAYTNGIMRRAITFLRAVLTRVSSRVEPFVATSATSHTRLAVTAGPTADGISFNRAQRNAEGLSTGRTDFTHALGSARRAITLAGAESLRLRASLTDVELLPAVHARSILTILGRGVVALASAVLRYPITAFTSLKRFPATLAGARNHGRHLWTLFQVIYTSWRGKSLVHNLTILCDPTYYANGVLVHNCPFCAQMHGRAVHTDDPFWRRGSEFGVQVPKIGGGLSRRTLKMPFEVQHPPLHPNCRCTMVPVITQEQAQLITPPPPRVLKPLRKPKPSRARRPKPTPKPRPKPRAAPLLDAPLTAVGRETARRVAKPKKPRKE